MFVLTLASDEFVNYSVTVIHIDSRGLIEGFPMATSFISRDVLAVPTGKRNGADQVYVTSIGEYTLYRRFK